MKFIDWFAGIGGFRRGMELAGHECVGFCEFDKFAVASYTSMHLITDEQREKLAQMDIKHRQKEILKDEYRNGEWYADDVLSVRFWDIPDADCWCFGFPCQDISIAGKQLGFTGNRSSLFFRIVYLLEQVGEEKRPTWLLIENVKNLLSVNGGWDFARLLTALDEVGYDCQWEVLNSKDFGVPQNRERVFIVGHLRGRSGREVLPLTGAGSENRHGIEQIGMLDAKRENPNQYRVYDTDGIAPTLSNMGGGGREPHVIAGIGQQNWNYRIRKLTPKECFRLQGWTDDYFEKAQFVNSDSQLYKQAGNGVTVTVIKALGDALRDAERDEDSVSRP